MEDIPLDNDDAVSVQSRAESHKNLNQFVVRAQQAGLDAEQTRQIKEVWKMAIDNEEKITKVEKKFMKQINDLKTDIRQVRTKSDLDLQQGVRAEMYEQIKQNNIGITKRLTELQGNVKRQLETNDNSVAQKIAAFEQSYVQDMEEFKV